MRDWRKVYGPKVVESDRLAECDFETRWLWLLYTLAQDDEGKHPYTRQKMLALTVGTGWTWDDCQRLTTGMSVVGLVTVSGGFVWIVNGAKYNGSVRKDRDGFVYVEQLPPAVDQRLASGEPVQVDQRLTSGEPMEDRELEGEERRGEREGIPVGAAAPPVGLPAWKERAREEPNKVRVLIDLVRTLRPDEPKRGDDGDLAAGLLKRVSDPEYAVALVFQSISQPNRSGSVFRYALGIANGASGNAAGAKANTSSWKGL